MVSREFAYKLSHAPKNKLSHAPKRELIEALRKRDLVINEEAFGAGGELLPLYVDVKKAYGYPEDLKMIAGAFWDSMKEKPDCIAVSGHGGLALGAAVGIMYGTRGLVLTAGIPLQSEYLL